ncbi:MAG: hypothetical protein LUI12_01965 [Clostridiales bacterium]|nr:hypothetical protein [Clostridiales bacterium]
MKYQNMDLWSIKDVIDNGEDGNFLAICDNGKEYECKYVTECRAMFFTIPANVKILGYLKIIGTCKNGMSFSK